MKKSEWIYLANALWAFTEVDSGKLSGLIKELLLKINNNMDVIIDDMGEYEQTTASDRPKNTNSTGNTDF